MLRKSLTEAHRCTVLYTESKGMILKISTPLGEIQFFTALNRCLHSLVIVMDNLIESLLTAKTSY